VGGNRVEKLQSELSAHKSGIICKKIFYLCDYALRSTRAPCSEALGDNVSGPSTTAFDITKDLRPSTDIQDGQDMLSPVWTSWDVDAMGCGRVPSLRVPVQKEKSLVERAIARGVQRKRKNGAASVDKGKWFDGERGKFPTDEHQRAFEYK
jgi:hypothetical protein